jgi:UDP-N-acetylglucosamine--N-acetylmuramyl-(pentapeptide) pyrophosphoryl-undecaprenol N-acetylglucosamine transferase
MRLLIAGGGTGGHLFPGIAVAEEFLARGQGNEVLFVGTEKGIEARLLPRLGYRLACIQAAGVRGKGGMSGIKGVAMLLHAYSQSRKILKEFKPDLVFGVGGYASGPTVLAARGMGINRFIHEQNAIPGLTNKILARFADQVFISLEESRHYFPEEKTLLTGNPLRKEILARVEERTLSVPSGLKKSDGIFRLLVFGGSAGAHSINQNMTAALPFLREVRDRLAITHQTGENDLTEVGAAYRREEFAGEILPFIDDMAAAYHSADLVICRAGATTIAEITACGKGCIFIPYPHAVDDHQRRNAEALLKVGAGFMLLEQELSGERLATEIKGLMADREQLAVVGRAARNMARLDAAKIIVDRILGS